VIKKINLHVEGMTCRNCEKRIESAVAMNQGIVRASASFKKSTVEIEYDDRKLEIGTILNIIEKLGYGIGTKPRKSISMVIGLVVLLFAGYYLINNTVGFNFIPEVSEKMGYGLIFVVGLLTSIHCIAMCGGIALSQSVRKQIHKINFVPAILYNIGRIVSYTAIGGVVGGIGGIITPTGQFKGVVAVIAGIFMFFMGLKMLNIIVLANWFKLELPKLNLIKKTNPLTSPFVIGLLNGFMPCGPLQTMQLYALGTGSVLNGALSMFFFSLGTVPLMLGFGIITSFISGKSGRNIMKASGVLVMILGIIMLNRGLALSGMDLETSIVKNIEEKTVKTEIEDGKQIIDLTIGANEYTPSINVVKVGVPIKIKLNVESLNRCNNPILIPAYGIEVDMLKQSNIIEFTPEKEGPIKITCWMGMITTNIVASN